MFRSTCKVCSYIVESTNYDMYSAMKRHVTIQHPTFTANFASAHFFTNPGDSLYRVTGVSVTEDQLEEEEKKGGGVGGMSLA
jgi:hypothetical protein